MEGLNFQKMFLISTNSRKIPGVCKRERELVGGGGGWVPGKAKIQECIELVVTAFWTYQMFKARK